MDHEKGGENEGDPQEGELCSEQRRDEVRRKSDSGHSLRSFLFVSISTCSMEPAFVIRRWLRNRPPPNVDCVNRSLSLIYIYLCRSKLDFLL